MVRSEFSYKNLEALALGIKEQLQEVLAQWIHQELEHLVLGHSWLSINNCQEKS